MQVASQHDPDDMVTGLNWTLHHYGPSGIVTVMTTWLAMLTTLVPDAFCDENGVPSLDFVWRHFSRHDGKLLTNALNAINEVLDTKPGLTQQEAFRISYACGESMYESLDAWAPVFDECLKAAHDAETVKDAENAMRPLLVNGPGIRPYTATGCEGANLLHVAAAPFIRRLRKRGTLPPPRPAGTTWPAPEEMVLADHGHYDWIAIYNTERFPPDDRP